MNLPTHGGQKVAALDESAADHTERTAAKERLHDDERRNPGRSDTQAIEAGEFKDKAEAPENS